MSAYNAYEKDLSKARHYRQYEHIYNATFAADPDPSSRKFDELAPKDSKQWERLEIYRGNDKDAYHAHKTHPQDPNFAPEKREEKLWAYNQSKHWDIDNRPVKYIDHDLSKNKWLPPMGGDKEKIYAHFESIDAKYGPQFDAYDKQAKGDAVMSKEQYLSTMAVIEAENMRSASQQQKQQASQAQQQSAGQTAPAQSSAAPATQTPAQQQVAPVAAAPGMRAFTGKLMEHGVAPYNDDPKASSNYFVKLETKDGEKKVWGVDLERAVADSGVQVGEEINLSFQGKKEVTIKTPILDGDRNVVGTKETSTYRNEWKVEAQEQPRRSRIKAENFTVDGYASHLEEDYSKRDNGQVKEVQAEVRAVMKADGANTPQEAFAQAQRYEAFRLSEAQRRADLSADRPRVHSQVESQERKRGLSL